MSAQSKRYVKFGGATAIILLSLGYLAYTGVQQSKSYYVTIKELRAMDNTVYSKRLRVAGNVAPGSIRRTGTRVEFTLIEQGTTLPVVYNGTEAPPDTFKDDSQALAEGQMGRDGVFRANQLQAKCASKYAPQQTPASQPGAKPNNAPLNNAPLNNAPPNNAPPNNAPLKSMTKVEPNASPGLSE
ncbi:MAG TPA: cytochrome c maturation protein CcmE [Terriglobales bacterium]|nr:cytochrome c maturation protein CcmE [Terriglobales bacterium]